MSHMNESFHVTHMNESSLYGVASISRLLKITVSFAKEPYKIDYILQKRPIILKSLQIEATPYEYLYA